MYRFLYRGRHRRRRHLLPVLAIALTLVMIGALLVKVALTGT
jgi:hypothetical protein